MLAGSIFVAAVGSWSMPSSLKPPPAKLFTPCGKPVLSTTCSRRIACWRQRFQKRSRGQHHQRRGQTGFASCATDVVESHFLLLGAVGLMHRARAGRFFIAAATPEHLRNVSPACTAQGRGSRNGFCCDIRGPSRALHRRTPDGRSPKLRALDSQPEDAFALAMRGFVYFHLVRDNDNARLALEQTVGLNPNEPREQFPGSRHRCSWSL